jgi:HEAT repeat protein
VGHRLAAIEPAWARAATPLANRKKEVSTERLLGILSSRDPVARVRAAQALGCLGAKEAVPRLRHCLQDDSKPVRSAAAIALVRMGDRAMLQGSICGLKDPSPKAVAGAALALGLSKSKDAVPHLLEAFHTHDPKVGGAVATALGMIGDSRAAAPLLAALKADFVPAEACKALGCLGDTTAAPAVIKALRHRDQKVRCLAARSLAALKTPLAGAPDLKAKALKGLQKLMEDPSKKVRLNAALALHALGGRGAPGELIGLLRQA